MAEPTAIRAIVNFILIHLVFFLFLFQVFVQVGKAFLFLVRIFFHGAELVKGKDIVSRAHPFLGINDGAFAFQLNGNGDQDNQRRKQQQGKQGKKDIESPLTPSDPVFQILLSLFTFGFFLQGVNKSMAQKEITAFIPADDKKIVEREVPRVPARVQYAAQT